MKIVNLDSATTNPGDLSWDFLNKYAEEVCIYERTAPDEIISRAKGAEILIINKTVLGENELKALSPELKYIGLQSTGYNVVDCETATELGITVCNIPSYSTNAVAQQVFAFILHFAISGNSPIFSKKVRTASLNSSSNSKKHLSLIFGGF